MPKSFHNSRIGPWDDRSAVFVGAKQQHGQEQVVVGVVEREQRRPCRQAQFHGGVKAVAPGADVHPAAGFGSEDRLEQRKRFNDHTGRPDQLDGWSRSSREARSVLVGPGPRQ